MKGMVALGEGGKGGEGRQDRASASQLFSLHRRGGMRGDKEDSKLLTLERGYLLLHIVP